MDPNRTQATEDGVRRPECFGHNGYGDGFTGYVRCHPRGCESAPACYAMLRERIEREHALESTGYEAERNRLRDQGLDSNQIVVALAGKGQPPPTQDAYLANYRQGQLASGLWRACRADGCDRLIAKSHDSVYCQQHEPREADGTARHGGQDRGARAASAHQP